MAFSTLNSQTFSTFYTTTNTLVKFHSISPIISPYFNLNSTYLFINNNNSLKTKKKFKRIKSSAEKQSKSKLRTCKNCKTQFDPSLNHPLACRFHSSHFGGETKRKFESVYSGGTMDTPNSGQVFQYWHCCGSEDPFDPGCTSAPHTSYDD